MKRRTGYLAAFVAMFLSFMMINSTSSYAWAAGGEWKNNTPNSVKCATPQGNSNANGTVLTLWDCTNSYAQKFQLTSDNHTLIHVASGKCVTPKGNSTANGTVLTLWTCTGSNLQQWEVGDYSLARNRTTSWVGDKCVTNYGDSQANGTWMTLWTCSGDWPRSQDWAMNWYH
ncbi:RICIN domain-containing protein [Streptomyces sp. NBC_00513]|uniref:RICIN domain-containing protein n=1 Tax=unclassified Streptomyces TaxID=2593676 RepID=UPI002255E735|nr:RICIN domain-containing protein [Streptomyces sp. NBC_00424]MCX5078726.1 RICIN domain-containing protein [Streptomyces sp. NBC_00424]WUD39167.1 RICIN domain-containing protein [Streptomyces sp. NBC_00513]